MNILSLKNIKYSFENTDILNGINLKIQKGECISIIGTSGSGKSTLLKLCSDLISPNSGEILFYDKDYKNYEPIDLRKQISYCMQIPYLFGENVYDNLAYPFKIRKQNGDKSKIINFLERLNLDESYLKKDINSLSGGEKQRVALIRNLIYKPEILLLDEVTSGLDSKNANLVTELVREMNEEGITILWITHNLEQSKSIFNRRIHIEEGQIIEEEILK
ncbi:MAG: ABC transporter ATP-binding protein [Romboutsia sp.]|uniref:ABC transporter ATP-binding protein n=1 Tax=Romboutsia sp. TaxID=1965302 RepID=UPI003F2B3A88